MRSRPYILTIDVQGSGDEACQNAILKTWLLVEQTVTQLRYRATACKDASRLLLQQTMPQCSMLLLLLLLCLSCRWSIICTQRPQIIDTIGCCTTFYFLGISRRAFRDATLADCATMVSSSL